MRSESKSIVSDVPMCFGCLFVWIECGGLCVRCVVLVSYLVLSCLCRCHCLRRFEMMVCVSSWNRGAPKILEIFPRMILFISPLIFENGYDRNL